MLYILSPSTSQWMDLLAAVQQVLDQGVITPETTGESFQGFYSNPLIVPNLNGGIRPILGLKTLNLFLWVQNSKCQVSHLLPPSIGFSNLNRHPGFLFFYLINAICALWWVISMNNLLPFPLESPLPVFTRLLALFAVLYSQGIKFMWAWMISR